MKQPWNRVKTRVSKVGKGLSKGEKDKKLFRRHKSYPVNIGLRLIHDIGMKTICICTTICGLKQLKEETTKLERDMEELVFKKQVEEEIAKQRRVIYELVIEEYLGF